MLASALGVQAGSTGLERTEGEKNQDMCRLGFPPPCLQDIRVSLSWPAEGGSHSPCQ